MLKIADAVEEIITGNSMLNFVFHHRLLNLSQVARFIRPLVEARTHKEVRDSAVHMSLSRLQTKLSNRISQVAELEQDFVLVKINIHSRLCSLTILKTELAHLELNNFFAKVQEKHGFITVTEGISEITAIIEEENFELAQYMITESLSHVYRNIASVGVKLSDKMLESPGVIYQILQQVALQNINVIEVTSTATEFNIYLEEKNVHLAFDSIYHRFSTLETDRSMSYRG